MQVELTAQDVQNLQVSVIQMAKSTQADAQAMKVLMILHDKLENTVKKESANNGSPVQEEKSFASKDFQEAAAEQHEKAVAAKKDNEGLAWDAPGYKAPGRPLPGE